MVASPSAATLSVVGEEDSAKRRQILDGARQARRQMVEHDWGGQVSECRL